MSKRIIYLPAILISFISLIGIYVYLNQQTRNTVTNKDSFETFNQSVQSQDECIDGTKFILRGNWIGKNFHGDDDLTIQLFEDNTFKIYDYILKSEFTGQWELLEQENSIEFTYNQSDKLDILFSLIESSLGEPLVPVKSYNVTNKSAQFGLYYLKQNQFEGKCIETQYNINYITGFAYKES
jgi:hypothetical protein